MGLLGLLLSAAGLIWMLWGRSEVAAFVLIGIGIVPIVTGIVYGHRGLKAVKQGRARNRLITTVGLVLGYLALGVWLVTTAGIVILFIQLMSYL
jgi:hypothetical protein